MTKRSVRIRHFHQGTVGKTYSKGASRPHKGRLLGTMATLDNDDGTVNVGFSIVNPGDEPNRKMGVMIAQKRLEILLGNKVRTLPANKACVMSLEKMQELMRTGSFLERSLQTIKKNAPPPLRRMDGTVDPYDLP